MIKHSFHPAEADSDILADQLEAQGRHLKFAHELEQEYQTYYNERYRPHMLLAIFLGLLATLACGVGDWLWLPAQFSQMWWVRLTIILCMLCVFLLAYRPALRPWLQWLIVIDAQVGTLGILLFASMATPPIRYYYQGGILLVMLIIFVLSRLQFGYGLLCAFLLTVMNNVFFWLVDRESMVQAIAREYILLIGLTFVMIGNFLSDRTLRQNYLQHRLLDLDNQDLALNNRHLSYLTAMDGLTLIANRRTLDSTLQTEFARALRKNDTLSLLMIDVDYFKQFNDTYGHPAGDNCLRHIAQTLRQFARRPGDLAARYGGEEFAIVLSGATEPDAMTIAESVRTEILALAIPHLRSQHGTVTVSIGVASLIPTPNQDTATLYQQADQALYRAKRSGRNRVIRFGDWS